MTVPNADLAHSYALECLVCGTTPDQVPNLHHGSDLNNLQAHMMDEHGFTWDDWQTPDWVAKTEVRRADGAMIYVWTRTTDDLPFMRAAQTTAPSGDTLYLDIASPSQACWDWRTNLVHLTDPAQGNSVTHCGLAVNGIDLPWFSRTQPYLAASDMCGACHDLAIGRQLARAVFARIDASLVLFESGNRVRETLADLAGIIEERPEDATPWLERATFHFRCGNAPQRGAAAIRPGALIHVK